MDNKEYYIKALMAFISLVAVIAGFFMGLVGVDTFIGIMSFVIMYFIKEGEIKQLNKQLIDKEEQISILSATKK